MSFAKLIFILAISPAFLSAESIVTASACGTSGSSESSGPGSLYLGPCGGPGFEPSESWVSARADPFKVALDGEIAYGAETVLDVSASAEWDGALEALGGSGSAFIDVQLGYNSLSEMFQCGFTSLGINQPTGNFCFVGSSSNMFSVTVPVTFGVPIDYTLFAANTPDIALGIPEAEASNLTILDITVVDGSGNAISGASVIETPEPSSIWLFGVAALSILPSLSRRLKGRLQS